ncbi:thiol peroxidase [Anaerotalea alkaliphila]|uniref:Thiol peroxidase n=1 Tax=Anaerotalea alkaliphila TaxID=2662126 RepID=A0A7X5HV46_9FIRM|nr:thiol peroxidase [Anaerotalea alkaliphila]NDL67198.1 thiol peroxidase [Anaerotalea alkaliphila]
MKKRAGAVTLGGNPMTLLEEEIKVGDVAPDFTVLDKDLNPVRLSDAKGKKVLISVVPSIDTPVCASQTRRFNEELATLEEVEVYTVSVDLPFALGRYCAVEGIDKVKTLSDHKELDFGRKYGFVIDELRILARGIVAVDEEGVVTHVEYVPEVTEHPDYERALEAVR